MKLRFLSSSKAVGLMSLAGVLASVSMVASASAAPAACTKPTVTVYTTETGNAGNAKITSEGTCGNIVKASGTCWISGNTSTDRGILGPAINKADQVSTFYCGKFEVVKSESYKLE